MQQSPKRTKKNNRQMRLYKWLTIILPALSVWIATVNDKTHLSNDLEGTLFSALLIVVFFGIKILPASFPTDEQKARRMSRTFLGNIAVVVLFGSANLYSIYSIFYLYGLTNVLLLFLFMSYLGLKLIAGSIKKKSAGGIFTGLVFAGFALLITSLPAISIAKTVLADTRTPGVQDYAFLAMIFGGIAYSAWEFVRDMREG